MAGGAEPPPAAVPETSAPAASEGRSERERRAEAVIDRVGQRLGGVVARAVARTREEAEDLWAEARQVRDRGPDAA